MATVAGTLQCTDNMVLWEGLEICDGKRKLSVHEPSDGDSVGIDVDVGNRSVIPIIAILGNEATPLVSFGFALIRSI